MPIKMEGVEILDPATQESSMLETGVKQFDKPDIDKENNQGTAPPKRGICRRCGLDRPINRLMLCYRCWVITMLEDEAKKRGDRWSEGMDHPDWCKCEGLGEHKNKDGTARGFN